MGLLAFGACTNKPVPQQEPEDLKNSYPVVHYHGPEKPFTVTIQRQKPEGWIPLDGIAPHAVKAILISEDGAFYSHSGFDFNQIRDAVETNLERGKFARGASTISQQVAKNVFLDNRKSLVRKLREASLTVQLEENLSKSRILEIYLNIVEWGEGIFGIRQASTHYFRKEPPDLNPKEGAFLAMLLPSPKKYSQSFRDHKLTEFASKRVNSILGKLRDAKVLTDEACEHWMHQRLVFEI
jgi:monofunctional glycosyltransferase